MLFAVIDTNVLVSALISPHPDSATVKVMRKVFEGAIIPVYSQKILAEYSGVLSRAKFRKYFNPRTAAVLIQAITDNGTACSGIPTEEKTTDNADIEFYEVLMSARRTENVYLVTGNIRDFPAKSYIVTPAQLIAMLDT